MSTFNKDQCVRMLEGLSEKSLDNSADGGKFELFEKFFQQLEKHSLNLTSNNICRAFACVEEQLKHEFVHKSKQHLKSL